MPQVLKNEFLKQEALALEPWPDNVVLYQPYEAEQILLTENASCLAVKTFLKMLNLPFSVKSCANAEFMATGKRTKLPVLKVGAFVTAEFENILILVEQKGISLKDHFLDEDEKSDLRAYMCMVEHVFTNAENYLSWIDPTVLNTVTYPRNGCVFPFPLNHIQNWRKRRNVLRQLSISEWKDKKLEEVEDDVTKCCDTLSAKLEDKKYFYGDKPTELDALVFGHLFSIFTMHLPNLMLAEIMNRYSNLTRFCKNIEETYFSK